MPFKNPHPLYTTWKAMRSRCFSPACPSWKNYGGRGITISERWNSFPVWLEDMGPRPVGAVMDRINNDGNYEPGNCRWTTRKVNQRNQRVTRWVTIDGEKHKAADLADVAGLKTDTIVERAQAGLSMEDVISPDRRSNYTGLSLGGKANGARLLALTHCKNGHEWNEENTRYGKRQRECRACAREKMRRRRH